MTSTEAEAPTTVPADRKKSFRRLALFAGLIAAAALVAWQLGLFDLGDRATLLAKVERARGWPFLIPAFLVAYAAIVTFGLPASPLTLAGGALFGFWQGFALNWLGATTGAFLGFVFARAISGGPDSALLGKRAEIIERLSVEHGFMSILRLRLLPVVPFSLLNFAAAMAGVRLRDFVLATAIGIVPGTAIYTFFADSLLRGAADASGDALRRMLIAGALLVALSFVPAAVRRIRGAGGN